MVCYECAPPPARVESVVEDLAGKASDRVEQVCNATFNSEIGKIR